MAFRRLLPARRWLLLFIGLGTAITILVLANGHRVSLAARRFLSGQERQESEALALARRYLDDGHAPRAIRALSRIGAGSIHEAEALTLQGTALASLDEPGPARLALERAWKLHPSADAARVLAAIYLSAYENERGLQMLIEASRLDPFDYRPWFAMGEAVYLRLQRYELAEDAFRQSLKRRPDHVDSRIGLIDALIKSHHVEEAELLLNDVLPERPDDPRVLVLATKIMVEKGDYQAGFRHVERALAIDPDHPEALILHARLLFRQRKRAQALAVVERACDLNPNDASVLTLLSVIQASLGFKEEAVATVDKRRQVERRSQAMQTITEEIRDNPDDPELRCRLGKLAEEAGMRHLAIQTYVAALARTPDYKPARQALMNLGLPAAKLPPVPRSHLAQGLPTAGAHRSSQSRP